MIRGVWWQLTGARCGGSHRSARRQERAYEFGRRHPRLTGVIFCVFLAGLIAICAEQIRHGTYLGGGWLIAVLAGMASAAVLTAAALISSRRHNPASGRFERAWLVLGVMSVSAIGYPFPLGPYGSVQAFFNVVHAALLGYEAVTLTAFIALLAYVLIRLRGLPGRAVLERPPVRAAGRHGLPDDTGQLPRRQMPRVHGWPGWVLAGAVAVAGLVAGFILAAVGGPDAHDAQSTAAGWVILFALATVCVAVPAALYRRYRSRRVVAVPPSLPGTSTAADPAGQD